MDYALTRIAYFGIIEQTREEKDAMQDGLFSGYWGKCHCQGIAVDKERKNVYYSFTTKLIKSDADGNIIGSVDNIIGHLGCIAYNDSDRKVYASLEYKNDSIGKGILKNLGGSVQSVTDGFYIAIFDVDKIDRMDMDAEKDGVMKTVYLKTVVDDYLGESKVGEATFKHVHGCSGIDGITFGPDFGSEKSSKKYLHVCYGVYSDLNREDNDYQVILQYDTDGWDDYARPHTQSCMHESGPNEPRNKYFVYTGNTNWGIQNIEYDQFTGDYFACVYRGNKPNFPNYPLFVIDGSVKAKRTALIGCGKEEGLVLALKNTGEGKDGLFGMEFEYGSTGIYSFGNGDFYVSHPSSKDGQNSATLYVYSLKITNGRWELVRK